MAKYESKKYDIAQIQREQLTPPRDNILNYSNTKDLLKFIANRIFTKQQLHEEYYLALNRIFTTGEGRREFLGVL